MSEQRRFSKPEVMSPAGYWPQLHAAIEAGADAVYFGLKHFTARAKVGFTLSELPDVMRTLHQRGVRGFVTFNTLVFEHELREATRSLAAIAEAGADAVIVQDIGIAQLARQIAPEMEVHGSTQMSITSAEGVDLARRFGANRVVLARELSLAEIAAIRQATDCELEMFVHGALCVSYSGQCFSSEAWGGRSANRGQCAQACRLPYQLLVDGKHKPLADARYLLSPGDLYAVPLMHDIIKLGISSLKIEGRYKDADYVALTTSAYRKAVDEAWAGLPLSITPAEELQLEQVYSRGLGTFFIGGTNHQTVVNGRAPRHRGVLIGMVSDIYGERIVLKPHENHAIAPLKAGDGVVFDAANWRSPEEREEGGRIYGIEALPTGEIELRFGPQAIKPNRIRIGDLIWRSHDPELDRAAKPFLEAAAPVAKQPLQVHVVAHEGQPLQLTWTVSNYPQFSVTVQSPEPLPCSQNRALTNEFLFDQASRLGNTAYSLAEMSVDISGQPFVPSSLLNNLRRQAIEQLSALQAAAPTRQIQAPLEVLAQAQQAVQVAPSLSNAPQLHILVRTPEQLQAAIAAKPASITLDYLELYGLKPAVELVQAHGITVRVASPRVLKPSEQRIIHFLLKLGCEIVVRSTGLLEALRQEQHPALIGDFSLNAANSITANTLLELGLERITPTHDLNAAQVAALAEQLGSAAVEVIAYQHLPVFHTEHCVFCRFLSNGTSFKDCGHPCEKHRVELRDLNGRAHPVMADVGCRNTVFGAEAQTAVEHLDAWRAAGIVHYRLEFVHETAEQVEAIIAAFDRTLQGQQPSSVLAEQLRKAAPQGITQGSLFIPNDYLRVPLMQ
ncbi:MAG: DUF3656 domain-containing protein [Chloroflexi bacterium]|nr:DUF3656 domain-containing protein [Chloroflexota bacterium]